MFTLYRCLVDTSLKVYKLWGDTCIDFFCYSPFIFYGIELYFWACMRNLLLPLLIEQIEATFWGMLSHRIAPSYTAVTGFVA